MNKKTGASLFIISGIIILIGVMIVAFYASGILDQSIGVPLSLPTGCKSSILSIDKVSLSRSSSDLGEEVFQITLSGKEAGKCVYGYLDSNELTQEIGNAIGKDVATKYTNPFLISLNRIETNAFYKISSNSERAIKKYDYIPKGSPIAKFISVITCKTGSLTQSSCSSQCAKNGYEFSNCEDEGSKGEGCYCWSFLNSGYLYGFNKDTLQEKIDVEIKTGDGGDNKISLDTNSASDSYNQVFRDGLYATFEGFLAGTKLIPDANAKVYDSGGTKKIVTISAGLSATQEPLCQDQISYTKLDSCMTNYNTALKIGFETPSEFSNAVISGTQIKLPISKDTFYPIIKIQLKAKWLGIYEPVSEPKISNCKSITTEFRNNKETYATYNLGIKEGTGTEGTFNIYASCSDPSFKVLQNENTQTVTGSNIVSGQIRVTQQENKASSSTCTIKASIQRLGFSAEDSCTFTATGKASCALESETCTSNSNCCAGLQCKQGICNKIPGVELCNNGIDDDSNGLTDCLDPQCLGSISCGGTCVNEGDSCKVDGQCCSGLACKENKCIPSSSCKWYDFSCLISSFLEKLRILFAIIFGFVAGALALSYSLKFTENLSSGLKIGLGIGSLLIFGIATGIITYIFAGRLLFLAIIAIALISFGVIRGFIGKLKF